MCFNVYKPLLSRLLLTGWRDLTKSMTESAVYFFFALGLLTTQGVV